MDKLLKTTALALSLIGTTLALSACAETRTTESTGAFIDNSVITAKVKAAILEDPVLKVLQIKVITFKNVVQLSGFVNTPEMKTRAGAVASRVAGVASVKNNLLIK